jgi:hypothetical protein
VISKFHKQDKDNSSIEVNQKKCCNCKNILTLDWFFKDKSRKTGLSAYCVACDKMRRKPRVRPLKEKLNLRLKFIKNKIKQYQKEIQNIEKDLADT